MVLLFVLLLLTIFITVAGKYKRIIKSLFNKRKTVNHVTYEILWFKKLLKLKFSVDLFTLDIFYFLLFIIINKIILESSSSYLFQKSQIIEGKNSFLMTYTLFYVCPWMFWSYIGKNENKYIMR